MRVILVLLLSIYFLIQPFNSVAEEATKASAVEEVTEMGSSIAKIKKTLKADNVGRSNNLVKSLEDKEATTLGRKDEAGLRMGKALGYFVGIFLIGFGLLKRYKGNSTPVAKSMRVLERLSISSKSALVLVEVEGKKILVAHGAEQVAFCGSDTGLEVSSGKKGEVICKEQIKKSA